MNKKILLLVLTLGLTLSLNAKDENIKIISENKIKTMDRSLTKHKARKRAFHTQDQFNKESKRVQSRNIQKSDTYNNGRNYNRSNYREPYRHNRQRGYRYEKRGWTLAYKYDRASFYDNQGYYYGYFNRHGYYFENIFYRYDRYYTYRDRIKGRGLFDRRYYIPANADYYGFSQRDYSRY